MLLHEEVTREIVDSAIEVHRLLGPGLLESVYEECLCSELAERSIGFERQVPIPVLYKGKKLECGFRADLIVEGRVVLELKSVEKLQPIHEAQLLTYLRLSGMKVGFVLNFNERTLRAGLLRRAL